MIIDELKKEAQALREKISQLTPATSFTGNAMGGLNFCLENLRYEGERREKAEKAEAEEKAKKLEEARKLVAEAEAAPAPAAQPAAE